MKPTIADAGSAMVASHASRECVCTSVAATARQETIRPTYIQPM